VPLWGDGKKNTVKPNRPQVTIQQGACALHAGWLRQEYTQTHTHTHTNVLDLIPNAFPRQKRLSERATMLRYTCTAGLVWYGYLPPFSLLFFLCSYFLLCSQVRYRLFMEVTYSLVPHILIVVEVLPRNFSCISTVFINAVVFDYYYDGISIFLKKVRPPASRTHDALM